MKNHISSFIALIASMIINFPSHAHEASVFSVKNLRWMAGCWGSVGGEAGSGEQWTHPAGGTLIGVSRTVKNSETVAYEYIQIRETADNKIEFIVLPSGQAGATFLGIKQSENEVIFENNAHDFPQRIIYRLHADDSLNGRIEGKINGEFSSMDFPLQRLDCESQEAVPLE